MKKHLYIVFLIVFLFFNVYSDNFFSSKIYNNDYKWNPYSTYTFLSEDEGYSLDDAKKKNFENIILIINGQQGPSLKAGDYWDDIFGSKLTGIHRLSDENGNFNGQYKIYKSDSKYSVAATLYDKYKQNSIIIDIPNAKYNWNKRIGQRNATENYLLDLIQELLKNKTQDQIKNINIFICGFSRGGVLTYVLCRDLYNKGYNVQGASIDPVINPTTENGYIKNMAVKKVFGNKWKIQNYRGIKKPKNNFPILKAPGCKYYNVFQRKAQIVDGFMYNNPIGCAVEGAISPADMGISISSAVNKTPFDQYDTSVYSHTPDMVDKFSNFILNAADTFLKKPKKSFNLPKPPIFYKEFSLSKPGVMINEPLNIRFVPSEKNCDILYRISDQRRPVSSWQKTTKEDFEISLKEPGNYLIEVYAKKDKRVSRTFRKGLIVYSDEPKLKIDLPETTLMLGETIFPKFIGSSRAEHGNDDELLYSYRFYYFNQENVEFTKFEQTNHTELIIGRPGINVLEVRCKDPKNNKLSDIRKVLIRGVDYFDWGTILASPNTTDDKDFVKYTPARLLEENDGGDFKVMFIKGTLDTVKEGDERVVKYIVKKTIPATINTVKAGDEIMYNYWNTDNYKEVSQSSVWKTGKILKILSDQKILIEYHNSENNIAQREVFMKSTRKIIPEDTNE